MYEPNLGGELEQGPIIGQGVMPEQGVFDIHHATITNVRLLRKDDGRVFFIIRAISRDRDYSNTLDLQIPNGFDDGCAKGSDFDPMTLPEDDENGRQQTLFRANFANRKNDAWLQRLVFNRESLARWVGKNPAALNILRKPESLEDYAHNLHEMLSGVECLMFQRVGKIWDLCKDTGDYSAPKFKGYKLAWEK
jgi:hypothetical protein